MRVVKGQSISVTNGELFEQIPAALRIEQLFVKILCDRCVGTSVVDRSGRKY